MSFYKFELSDPDDLLRLLEPHAISASDPMSLALALLEAGKKPPVREELWAELQIALGYELDEQDDKPGAIEFHGEGYSLLGLGLRSIQDASDDSRQLWQGLFDKSEAPILRAQFGDLILTSRVDSSPSHAQRTISAYIETSEQSRVDSLHATFAIMRANHLARSRNMSEAESSIRESVQRMAGRSLDSGSPPGIVLRLLDVLSVAPRSGLGDDERAEILGLLDRAEGAFSEPSAADSIADARRRLASDDVQRADATRRQFQAYMRAARESSDGFLQMHWAKYAAELATKHGDQELRDEAIRYMQAIPPENMGWKVFESSVHIPRNALRLHLRRYKAARDWRRAIALFLAGGSPTGSHEHNIELNRKLSRGRLVSLFSRTVYGRHGLPERTGGDFETGELHRLESFAIQNQGILLSLELDEIRRRFGPVDSGDLAAWLASAWDTDPEYAQSFAEALGLYWRGDPGSAARLSIPLCESGLRRLLLTLDEPVYRLEQGKSPGKFPSMDFYLGRLEKLDLDIDWVRAFRAEFLNEGLNVRNLFAHGFKLAFSKEEAAVTIRLAGLFIGLSTLADENLATPSEPARRRLRRRLGWIYT